MFMFMTLLLVLAFYGSPSEAFTSPRLRSRSDVRLDPRIPASSVTHETSAINNPLCHPSRRASASKTTLGLFGNIFGTEEAEEDQKDLREGELARFSYELPADVKPEVKFDSLSIMISEWSKLFTDEEKKTGLTTPVAVVDLTPQTVEGDANNYSGVQLLFQKKKTGYADKDENKYKEQGKEKDKEEAVKEGGVEVRVEQSSGGDLSVTASRCEIEEGTMVKEMSEQTIVDSLRKAIVAWKKEQLS